MLARDQIRSIARELDRSADERIRRGDRLNAEQEPLWEAVRRACRAIQTVAEMETDGMTRDDRRQKARYIVSEFETALEAAKTARSAIEWTLPRHEDD